MSKVTYGQAGYDGQSMSIRAREAYEAGEMPKSRWTKAAMLAAIEAWCRDNDRIAFEILGKLRKDELFARCFAVTSWHHTGKYANATDFYGVDGDAADAFSRPMTGEELAESEAERDAERARQEAEAEEHARAAREEGEARRAARQGIIDALGPAYDYIAARNPVYTSQHTIIHTIAADEALHQEDYETRVAKSGRVMLRNVAQPCHTEVTLDRACTTDAWWL